MRCSHVLKATILGLCLAVSIIQIGFAIDKVLSKPTMTSSGTVSLKALDQPISISVCKNNQLNYTRSLSIGYSHPYLLFSGNISLGENAGRILSWTGTSGNMTFNEMLQYLYQTDEKVEFGVINGKISTTFLFPTGFCKVFETYPKNYLEIKMRNCDKSDSFLVTVYDPASVNSFQIARMPGGKLLHECRNGFQFVDYNVHLTKTEDKSGRDSCVEYPTKDHKTYAECVDDEIERKTKPVFGYGLPFVSNSTGKPIQRLPQHESTVEWLESLALLSFGGVMYQSDNCLPPCTALTAIAEMQQSTSVPGAADYSALYIFFDERVDVETTVVAYGPASLLVEIGSCLGLWLGLSVIGACDLAIMWCVKVAARLKKH